MAKMKLFKYGKVVFMSFLGDWTDLPGGLTIAGTVPSDFLPIETVMVGDSPYNAPQVRITIQPNGAVQVYNYGGSISSASNANYCACWITN